MPEAKEETIPFSCRNSGEEDGRQAGRQAAREGGREGEEGRRKKKTDY